MSWKFFAAQHTPGKNKLFRKNEFRTNGCLHENQGVKSFSQLRDERNFLPDLVVWPGLCSSALASMMTKYAHLRVGLMILRPGFHGGVRLSGTHFF